MQLSLHWTIAAGAFLALLGVVVCQSKYSWMWYDQFDEVDYHTTTVSSQNCRSKSKEDLVLRPDTVSQLPVYNQLKNKIWYRNRTDLIHMHNMALNRAFFYSYILQKMNDSAQFYIQPNWIYMYMSAVADINANPNAINGSALYFDQDSHYPNWYHTVPFNNTLPLFGPKAWRWDDYRDQGNILREPTRRTAMVADIGAGLGMNYTHPMFKMNPWYGKWLPDLEAGLDSLTKFTYSVGIKYSNETGRFTKDEFEAFPFFGPNSPSAQEADERRLPVVWTQPYYDCGRYNNWIVSAVSPVVDYMPRYSNWTHLRRQRIVGVIVMDREFKQTDFNACDVGTGNPGPSYLSNIHRCRGTTSCKHRNGMGFKRGGYNCPCKSGYKYPWSVEAPWTGEDIEQAIDTEYYNSFMCEVSDFRQALPNIDQLEGVSIVGGTNDVSSGGVQLETQGIEKVESDLVDPEVRLRHIRSANDSSTVHHNGGIRRNAEGDVIWSLHDGAVMKTRDENERNDESIMPVRPPVRVPYGMHQAVDSVHDKRPISQAQINAALKQRRLDAQNMRAQSGGDRDDSRKGDLIKGNPARADKQDVKSGSTHHNRRKRFSDFDEQRFNRMMRIFRQKDTVNKDNCHTMAAHNLELSGDVAYGVNTQFESEARTALRLSHFLSNFLQNTDPSENFGNMRGGGRLHQEHLFGEVLANVMGNFKIYSAGVFFDRYMFENQDGTKREFFGPWAYRKDGGHYVVDTAGLRKRYIDEEWFQTVKGRWATNFVGLEKYRMSSYIRSDPQGTSSIRHEHFPLVYKAPVYSAGYWTRPHFKCDGQVDAWVVTYVTPFFGLDQLKRKLQFKGVVTVDVPLNLLEISPCPQGFGVANAFKNTARCDFFSTKCSVIAGYPFQRGSYKCDCRQGFEYPHLDGREWFQGSLLESEYEKKIRGLYSRFDQLVCRVAAAPRLSSPVFLLVVSLSLVGLICKLTST